MTADDHREATSFCRWFADNRDYLAGISAGLYGYDEDVLSDVFENIYTRILGGVRIKEYAPYARAAIRLRSLASKRKTSRLLLVENYDKLNYL